MLIHRIPLTLATPLLVPLHGTQIRHLHHDGRERARERGRERVAGRRDGEAAPAGVAGPEAGRGPEGELGYGGGEAGGGFAAGWGGGGLGQLGRDGPGLTWLAASRVHGERCLSRGVLDVPTRSAGSHRGGAR